MLERFRQRWYADGGYRELLAVALPLIVSFGSLTVKQFVDSVYLSRYDPSHDHLAAVVPASNLNYTIFLFFMGTAGYVNTFVAQYYGAERYGRIGRSVWQGIYFGLFSGVLLLGLIPLAGPIVDLVDVGGNAEVRRLETIYFRLMFVAGPFLVTRSALTGFFSGRGRTMVIMWTALVGMLVNIGLNWVFIFGRYGFPEWGMAGAAAGTIISIVVEVAIYAIIFFGRPCREVYGSLREWRFEWDLFRRLLRYGAPTGAQISLNLLSFALFMFLVGELGKDAKAATALAFRVETVAFLPMLGTSFAVTALVGRRLTQQRVDIAEKTTWSGAHVAGIYMTLVAALFFFVPGLFVELYGMGNNAGGEAGIARVLLRFVAVYSVFNSLNLIFNAALRGAGDTRFVAVLSLVLSWTVMLAPAAIAIFVVGNLYLAWAFVTLYAVSLAGSFFWRYRTGQWKRMRVIEDEAAPGVE